MRFFCADDYPSNGDMHEVVRGKFFAFKGPTGRRKALGFGRFTLIPSDYFDVFKVKNIRAVVRLNNKEYDRSSLVQAGFNHYDLFFTDCSTPSDSIVDKFLRISEQEEGSLAVHCLAGLGRTGTLIAMYMMKHMGFSANECIAWLRIVRPGSVIGPQQQYLKDQEARMWAIGKRNVVGLGLNGKHDDMPASPGSNSAVSAELADMVTKGMQIREQGRFGNGGVGTDTSASDQNNKPFQLTLPRQVNGALARPSQGHSNNSIGSCPAGPGGGNRSPSVGAMTADYLDSATNGPPHTAVFSSGRNDVSRKSAPSFSSSGRNVLNSTVSLRGGGGSSVARDTLLPARNGNRATSRGSPKQSIMTDSLLTQRTPSSERNGSNSAATTPTGKVLTASRQLRVR